MPRWITKETSVVFAGRILLSPYDSNSTQLEDTEVELVTTLNTELTPTISGIPYAQAFGNDTAELTLPVLSEYATVHEALAAQDSEFVFARSNPKGTLAVGYTRITPDSKQTYPVIEEGENNASYKWCHIDASRLSTITSDGMSNRKVTAVRMYGPGVVYEDQHFPIYLGIFSATTDNVEETPTLLAISSDMHTLERGAATEWNFPGFTLRTGRHLRIQAYSAETYATAPTWNPTVDIRTAVHVLSDDVDYETSSFCVSAGTKKVGCAPRLELVVTGHNLPTTDYRSYSSAVLSELTHRLTLGPHAVRLISTWRFAIPLRHNS